jgi:hypothetical protein
MILNLIKYFGKFPLLEGVLNLFSMQNNSYQQYAELKNYFVTLPLESQSLIPEIKNFIIGVNADKLTTKIQSLKDLFLLVEYGNEEIVKKEGNTNSTLHITITIGLPFAYQNHDLMSESIAFDLCRETLIKLLKLMEVEWKKRCHQIDYLNFPITIGPVEPKALCGCAGYFAEYKITNQTILY